MNYFMISVAILVFGLVLMVHSDDDVTAGPFKNAAEPLKEKSQEKRAIGYNNNGYRNGFGSYDPSLGAYNTGYNSYQTGYPYQGGSYNPYTTRVAGIGDYTGSAYNNGYNGYNTVPSYNGYTGYTGYSGAGGIYSGGYNSGVGINSRFGYPYSRPRYYSSYPSSYYNSGYGNSMIVDGGLGGLSPPLNAGYNYGPGVSGSVY